MRTAVDYDSFSSIRILLIPDQAGYIDFHVRYGARPEQRISGNLGIALFVALGAWTLRHFGALSVSWEFITAKVAVWVAPLGVVATRAGRVIQIVNEKFKDAYNRLVSLKQTIESRPMEESVDLKTNREALEQARSGLDEINQEIGKISMELDELRSGRKLLKFIEEHPPGTFCPELTSLASF